MAKPITFTPRPREQDVADAARDELDAWSLIAIRDRRDKVIVAGYGIGMAVQVALSWSHLNSLGEGTPTHLGPTSPATSGAA